MSSATHPELYEHRFEKCQRCRVKRPVSELDMVVLPRHREFRCKRADHCAALLGTTPPPLELVGAGR